MDETTPPPPPDEQSPPPPPPLHAGSPTDFLKGVVGKRVIVRLTSGVDYRGVFFFESNDMCANYNISQDFFHVLMGI